MILALAAMTTVSLAAGPPVADSLAAGSPAEAKEEADPASIASAPVAAYRGQLDERALRSWIRSVGEGAAGDRATASHQALMTKTLAEEARRLRLDRKPATRVELARRKGGLANSLLDRDLEASIVVTDEEAEAKYQAIKDTYTRPRRLRLRTLFRRFPPDADDAARNRVRAEIDAIRTRVVAGESFEALAAELSHSQTRFTGGLLGNVRPGSLPPAIDHVAMAMTVGEVSAPLPADGGLMLLYCQQVLPKVVRSAETLRGIARDLVANQRYRKLRHARERRLREQAAVRIDWPCLEPPRPDPEADFVTFVGGRVSLSEAAAVAAPDRTIATLKTVPRTRVHALIDTFIHRRMKSREAAMLGLTGEAFEERWLWVRRQILMVKAISHHLSERLVPLTESEIRAFFTAHRADFERPLHFDLSVLALEVNPDDRRPAYRTGERIVHELDTGTLRFEDAARRYSALPSAAQEGSVGWLSRWQIPKRFGIDFLRALLTLEVGERSDLVESEGRLWIVRVEGREAARPATFEEARTSAENRLGSQRLRQLESAFLAEWSKRIEVVAISADPGATTDAR